MEAKLLLFALKEEKELNKKQKKTTKKYGEKLKTFTMLGKKLDVKENQQRFFIRLRNEHDEKAEGLWNEFGFYQQQQTFRVLYKRTEAEIFKFPDSIFGFSLKMKMKN